MNDYLVHGGHYISTSGNQRSNKTLEDFHVMFHMALNHAMFLLDCHWEVAMISPLLIDMLYAIAQLLCDYIPQNETPASLADLHHCIETARRNHNARCIISAYREEEWDLTLRTGGHTLFFMDALKREILICASDIEDTITLVIQKENRPVFHLEIDGDGNWQQFKCDERALSDDKHITLLHSIDKDILGGTLFTDEIKLEKLPSYALH